jgi:hypothetical protein
LVVLRAAVRRAWLVVLAGCAQPVLAGEPLGVTSGPYTGLPAYLQARPGRAPVTSERRPVAGRPLEPRERERLDLLLHSVAIRGSLLDARSSRAERVSLLAEVQELDELAHAVPGATGIADELVGVVEALPLTRPEQVVVMGGRIEGLVAQLRARLLG